MTSEEIKAKLKELESLLKKDEYISIEIKVQDPHGFHVNYECGIDPNNLMLPKYSGWRNPMQIKADNLNQLIEWFGEESDVVQNLKMGTKGIE
jgi:hypothetical protein